MQRGHLPRWMVLCFVAVPRPSYLSTRHDRRTRKLPRSMQQNIQHKVVLLRMQGLLLTLMQPLKAVLKICLPKRRSVQISLCCILHPMMQSRSCH